MPFGLSGHALARCPVSLHMKHVANAKASAPFNLDSQSREVCSFDPHWKTHQILLL